MNLSENVKVTRIMTAQAAGTTDKNSDILDMQNFDGVVFIASFGTIVANAVTFVKAQQDADSAFGDDPQDLEGTKISVADDDDDKVAVLDVYRPQERYVRLVVGRGTQNATIDGVIAIQYKGRKAPVTHDSASVLDSEVHASPDEGTA